MYIAPPAETLIPLEQMMPFLILLIIFSILILACLYSAYRLKRGKKEHSVTTISEREVVTERVLVVCPFCGTKNEQGITKCQNCKGDL